MMPGVASPFFYHTLKTHRERDGRGERVILREMLYLYRKNEACGTKRQKVTSEPVREAAKGWRGGKTHQERKYDMDPLFVMALLLLSAIEKEKHFPFSIKEKHFSLILVGVHVFSW